MKTLLVVEVSPRLEFSVSRNLTARFVEQWKKGNPHGVVVVRDLFKSHIPFVDLHWIGGAFTPQEQHSPANRSPFKRAEFGSPIRMAVCALFIAAGIATLQSFAGAEQGS